MNANETAAYAEAVRLYKEGRFAEALTALNAIDRIKTERQEIAHARALCLFELGYLDDARGLVNRLYRRYGDGPWRELEVRIAAAQDAVSLSQDDSSAAVAPPRRRGRPAGIALVLCAIFGAGACVVALMNFHKPGHTSVSVAPVSPLSISPVAEAPVSPSSVSPIAEAPIPGDSAESEESESLYDTAPSANLDTTSMSVAELLGKIGQHDVSVAVAARLTEVATRDDLAAIHDALQKERDRFARLNIVFLISHIGSSTSVGPLCDAMERDSCDTVRWMAGYSVGRLGDRRAAKRLAQAMETDKSGHVRRGAAAGLRTLLDAEAVPYLQAALAKEQDKGVQQALRWLTDNEYKGTVDPAPVSGTPRYASYKGFLYAYYLPKDYVPELRYEVLVAVHGTDGTCDGYLQMCQSVADKRHLVVVAPYFDSAYFLYYNLMNIGAGLPRSDLYLLQIIDEIAKTVNIRKDKFYLFGHSKGGQFVVPFVLGHSDRIIRAAACSCRFYPSANPEIIYPGGTKPQPFAPDLIFDFDALVQTPLAIVVGEKEHAEMLEKSRQFVEFANQYARERHLPCLQQLFVVKGGYHAGTSNFPTACEFLFGGK